MAACCTRATQMHLAMKVDVNARAEWDTRGHRPGPQRVRESDNDRREDRFHRRNRKVCESANERCQTRSVKTWNVSQKMPVALLTHPYGAVKMTVVGLPRALLILRRIDAQHDPTNFLSIGTFRVGDRQVQIRANVLIVIGGQH